MTKIQIKRIYDPVKPSDGFRVLVDKLWPRGISKERADLDFWAKDIAPSAELREAFHMGADSWSAFEKAYRKELKDNPAVDDFIKLVKDKGMVTLLFASKEPEHNHAIVLADVLRSELRQ